MALLASLSSAPGDDELSASPSSMYAKPSESATARPALMPRQTQPGCIDGTYSPSTNDGATPTISSEFCTIGVGLV